MTKLEAKQMTTSKPRKRKRAPRKRKPQTDVPVEALPAMGQSTSNDPTLTRPPNPTTEKGWVARMNTPAPKANSLSGKDLMREPGPDAVGSMREIKVWIGLREDCPAYSIKLVGTTFSKRTSQIIADPSAPGQQLRVPVLGVITKWTKTTFDALCVAIPMRIIRWDPPVKDKERPGKFKKRTGKLVRIPTDDENAYNVQRGRAARYHTDQIEDEPVAKYLYVVFFSDGETPKHGREVPPTMDVTGLEWPEE